MVPRPGEQRDAAEEYVHAIVVDRADLAPMPVLIRD